MRWQIPTPTRALVLQGLSIFSGILFGIQICSCQFTWSIYHRTDNTLLTNSYDNLWKVTAITCCSICHSDSSCKSVTYNRGSQECRLSSVSFTNVGSNSKPSDEWKTYSEYQSSNRDCNDIDKTEHFSSGVFEILPVGAQVPVNVFCDFEDPDGPWTVIQRRVDDTVDFYRNYTEYQVGFGNFSGNFWLGLDKISSITLQDGKKYCLKVTVVDTNKIKSFAQYSHFHVMNATTGYKLQVGGYTGDAVNALRYHNGLPFTTYDLDMDGSTKHNCAKKHEGAWWYNNCHHSNLNGIYGNNTFGKGINWGTTTGYDRSATFASMKIKECL